MVHPLIRPLGLFISVLGLIQGVAWFILALLAILIKQDVLDVTLGDSFGDRVNGYLISMYLKEHQSIPNLKIIATPEFFEIFLYLYLASSPVWSVVSGIQIWYLYKKTWGILRPIFIAWSAGCTLITIADLVITIVLVLDYTKITEKENADTALYGTAILFTLTARGFVLWLMNVISIIVIIIFIFKLNIENNKLDVYNTAPPINAFQEPTPIANLPWYAQAANTDNALPSHVNSAFIDDDDECWDSLSFVRSKSFQYPSTQRNYSNNNDSQSFETISRHSSRYPYNNNSLPRNVNSRNLTHRSNKGSPQLATIGRAAKGSPVLKVSPPRVPPAIPPPDYTPPPSPIPKLRPVLKSNNVYSVI